PLENSLLSSNIACEWCDQAVDQATSDVAAANKQIRFRFFISVVLCPYSMSGLLYRLALIFMSSTLAPTRFIMPGHSGGQSWISQTIRFRCCSRWLSGWLELSWPT